MVASIPLGSMRRSSHRAPLMLSTSTISARELSETAWEARVSEAAYASNEGTLVAELAVLGCHLRRFSQQRLVDFRPQWFHCARDNGELIVAFRGTMSATDALTDARVEPVWVESRGLFIHSGFFRAARGIWVSGLSKELTAIVVAAAPSVKLVGHSLGGRGCRGRSLGLRTPALYYAWKVHRGHVRRAGYPCGTSSRLAACVGRHSSASVGFGKRSRAEAPRQRIPTSPAFLGPGPAFGIGGRTLAGQRSAPQQRHPGARPRIPASGVCHCTFVAERPDP